MDTFSYKHLTIPLALAIVYSCIASFMFSIITPGVLLPPLQVISTALALFILTTLFTFEYNQTRLSQKVIIYILAFSLLLTALDCALSFLTQFLWNTFYFLFYDQTPDQFRYFYIAIQLLLNLIKLIIAAGVSYYYFRPLPSNNTSLSTTQINLITLVTYSVLMASPVYTWFNYKQILTSINLNLLLTNLSCFILLLLTVAIYFIYVYAWSIRYLRKVSSNNYAFKITAFYLLNCLLYILFMFAQVVILMIISKLITTQTNYTPMVILNYLLAVPTFFFFLFKGQLMIYKIIHCILYLVFVNYVWSIPESLLMPVDYIATFSVVISYISIVLWALYGANQIAITRIFK